MTEVENNKGRYIDLLGDPIDGTALKNTAQSANTLAIGISSIFGGVAAFYGLGAETQVATLFAVGELVAGATFSSLYKMSESRFASRFNSSANELFLDDETLHSICIDTRPEHNAAERNNDLYGDAIARALKENKMGQKFSFAASLTGVLRMPSVVMTLPAFAPAVVRSCRAVHRHQQLLNGNWAIVPRARVEDGLDM